VGSPLAELDQARLSVQMQAHRIVFRILGRQWLEREVAPSGTAPRLSPNPHTELTALGSDMRFAGFGCPILF